jgi:hypothetical protein
MFSGSLTLFALTIVVMSALLGLAVVGGLAISRIRMKRFLKVFNEDIKKPAFEKPSN